MPPGRGGAVFEGCVLNIGEFAARSGVSADTLRYYEKIGVLRQIARNASGHRVFDKGDLDWIAFVTRLKDTGMPLAGIREYAQLRHQGAATAARRRALLEDHAAALEQRLARAQDSLSLIRAKIAWYQGQEEPL